MTPIFPRLPIVPLTFLALLLAFLGWIAPAHAQRPQLVEATSTPFSQAELFFELNDTDGDLGLHAAIDGGPWTDLQVEGPGERQLLGIFSRGRLRTQGLTQLSFESAEPSFDELSPAAFFRRFPEGRYEIEARTHDGREIASIVRLSHVLAAPPENVTVGGQPAAENCDAEPLPTVAASTPVLIDWSPVNRSHPEIGRSGSIRVSRYQFFAERPRMKLSVDLPPAITEFEIPVSLMARGVVKFEIIVRTAEGNNTAIESCLIAH